MYGLQMFAEDWETHGLITYLLERQLGAGQDIQTANKISDTYVYAAESCPQKQSGTRIGKNFNPDVLSSSSKSFKSVAEDGCI